MRSRQTNAWVGELWKALIRAAETRKGLRELGGRESMDQHIDASSITSLTGSDGRAIYEALMALSSELAESYAQIKRDLADPRRLSWSGTAHEIREVLARLLRMLAPDDKVKTQSWYEQERGTSGPTHRQRARYALEQQGAGSRQIEVVEEVVDVLEDKISALIRATYVRASDAVHRSKQRQEITRTLRYFEAFAHDLLNLG